MPQHDLLIQLQRPLANGTSGFYPTCYLTHLHLSTKLHATVPGDALPSRKLFEVSRTVLPTALSGGQCHDSLSTHLRQWVVKLRTANSKRPLPLHAASDWDHQVAHGDCSFRGSQSQLHLGCLMSRSPPCRPANQTTITTRWNIDSEHRYLYPSHLPPATAFNT